MRHTSTLTVRGCLDGSEDASESVREYGHKTKTQRKFQGTLACTGGGSCGLFIALSGISSIICFEKLRFDSEGVTFAT